MLRWSCPDSSILQDMIVLYSMLSCWWCAINLVIQCNQHH